MIKINMWSWKARKAFLLWELDWYVPKFYSLFQAYVEDYNITAKSPCTGILGQNKGVCPDEDAQVGGTNDNQIQTFSRENGITRVSL